MPTSRSPRPRTDRKAPAARRHAYWPLIPLAILIGAATLIAALPAAILGRLLPPDLRLVDASGTIWHGAAADVEFAGRGLGALEWRLHPLALLRGAADLDLHWVDLRWSATARASLGRQAFRLSDLRAAGPIADLAPFGLPPGWSGTATVDLHSLGGDYHRIATIDGQISIAHLASAGFANGIDLGDYRARLGTQTATGAAGLGANIEDLAGPLRLRATVSVDQSNRRALVSGTVAARPDANPAIVAEVERLARMRGRNAAGEVPLDVELGY